MALVVQKYGGTSVGTAERIKRVAGRVLAARQAGHDVVVVASAMGGTTDELIDLAHQVCVAPPSARELDMLLTSGERIANALLAMALTDLGCPACSLSGEQAGVLTTSVHGRARIVDVLPERVRAELDRGRVVVVAGFQGVDPDSSDVTTLGRGGSDTTAVAMAAALGADVCEIYTDVDGVCTADPRIVPEARLLAQVSYEDMVELASSGARVLMPRSVGYARRHGVPMHIRSSFTSARGTTVLASTESTSMEQHVITGVAHASAEAKVVVVGVPDEPARTARALRALADVQVEVDIIVQNASPVGGRVDLTFTLPRGDRVVAVAALRAAREAIGFDDLRYDDRVGKVSLVGAGMRGDPNVAATFCEALAGVGLSLEIMSASESRMSAVCRENQVEDAVRALHEAFELAR
ncbi:MAG TPA: aspartate kinase [Kutzneria sp.]|jgi:aspartate kinase|nr:aspartate kinase [Kutzneria sp.]